MVFRVFYISLGESNTGLSISDMSEIKILSQLSALYHFRVNLQNINNQRILLADFPFANGNIFFDWDSR